MRRVQLIHWNRTEAEEKAAKLRLGRYNVANEVPQGLDVLRNLRMNPPDAVVIDLSRLPAQGRDFGLAIRYYQSTRRLPLLFVGGETEKVNRIKEQLPDAVYATWGTVLSSLKWAIAHPPTDPVVPRSLLDGYSKAPPVKKLGIKADSVVTLVNAPPGFEKSLGKLPDGVILRRKADSRSDLILWFTRSGKELESSIGRIAAAMGQAKLWIVWPKKASGVQSDLTQQRVRDVGLAAGLVDYKVCSIDATRSGLLFVRRRAK